MYDPQHLGGLKKTLKKIGKAVKKPLLVATGAAATYFGAGEIGAPLMAKGLSKTDKMTAAEKLQIAIANSRGIVEPGVPLFTPANPTAASDFKITPVMVAGGILALALIARNKS